MQIVILVIGWAVYFFMHSFLAADNVKVTIKKNIGRYYRYYRIVYVIISTLGLLLLLIWNASIPSVNYFSSNVIDRYLSLMFAAFGVILIKVAFRAYNFSSFIGLGAKEEQSFTATGILRSIRHPIYSGTILVAIGFWLFSPNLPTLVSVACIFGYLPIGIALEERKLISKFGENYLEYKRKVPALFPRIF